MKRLAITGVLLVIALAVGIPAVALEQGVRAPDFALQTLDGKAFRLEELRGRIILLKLATTWCPTCRDQSRELSKAKDLLLAHDVAIVEVFLQDGVEMVRNYMRENDPLPSTTILLDDDRIRRSYNVYLIPRTLIIDREFRVRRDGHLLLRTELEKILTELPQKQGP